MQHDSTPGQAGAATAASAQAAALTRWSNAHAAAMLVAIGASVAISRAWPLSLLAVSSLGVLVARARWLSPTASLFGAANLITSLRLLLVCGLGAWPWSGSPPSPRMAAVLALTVFALDGLDGWAARRLGQSTSFGARYDMEVDAAFVAVLSCVAWQVGAVPALALLAGALRYLYVLALALLRASDADAPRTLIGRGIFAVIVLCLAAALWPLPYRGPAVVGATALLLCSFGRSFAWSLRTRGGRGAPGPSSRR